jgi:hypothetical protein
MAYVMALQQGWATDKLQFEGVSAPHFNTCFKVINIIDFVTSQKRYSRVD